MTSMEMIYDDRFQKSIFWNIQVIIKIKDSVIFSMKLFELLTSYTEIRYIINYCHCMNGNTFDNNMKNNKSSSTY